MVDNVAPSTPDQQSCGNAAWTLLHTVAAYYPDRPAPSQMESMRTFITTFLENYPFECQDIRNTMLAEPVRVGSRRKLSEWLCRRHNEMNEKLGKEKFDCARVFERWLDGNTRCNTS